MELKCKRCEKEWDYKGKKKPHKIYPVYVICPNCHTTVRLQDKNETPTL